MTGKRASEQDEVARATEARRHLRHELRTPLNQIIGYSELLQEEVVDVGQPALVPDLERIASAARRLVQVVDGLALDAALIPPPASPPLGQEGEAAPAVNDEAAGAPSSRAACGLRPLSVPPEADGAEAAGPARLLVVDDNDANRDMLVRRLRKRGYSVGAAAGGREALEALRAARFDLLLLDVMMPEVSGLEVLATLRQTHGPTDLPVIMVTARDASADVVEALKLGANDYVTKPIDFAVAEARVSTQLSLKLAVERVALLNRRLFDAQARIDELARTAASSGQELTTWATSIAEQLAHLLDAQAVEIVELPAEQADHGALAGRLGLDEEALGQLLLRGGPVLGRERALFLVRGSPGEHAHGVVVVRGKRAWSAPDRRLVGSFAQQLGSALELQRLRAELARAAAERHAHKQRMLDDGVELLRLCGSCGRCHPHTASSCGADGTPLGDAEPRPYRIADRYRLEQLCGVGGMGSVYRAFDERLHRRVALKVINIDQFDNLQARQRFDAEARTTARVDHPGVVAVFDSGELEDGSRFIVMEWLNGCDLRQLLADQGAGTPEQVASLLREGGEALSAAHDAGLIHRDIKPANVFLVPDGNGFRVKLVDFGIAKEVSVDAGLTGTDQLVGTPLYMSPEQLLQRPLDARSDLYSFAAVAFEALTGQRVVDGTSFGEVVLATVRGEIPLASSFLPELPLEVDEAFAIALDKHAAARPARARDWASALAELLRRVPRTDARGWRVAASLPSRTKSADATGATVLGTGLEANDTRKERG